MFILRLIFQLSNNRFNPRKRLKTQRMLDFGRFVMLSPASALNFDLLEQQAASTISNRTRACTIGKGKNSNVVV
jgi:hypothetical protein